MSETSKAYNHRLADGWFYKYAPSHLSGIDIGCQSDPLNATFRRYDTIYNDSDATYMEGVPDGSFHTVYASHVLEHISDPVLAIKNWWRILEVDGHLILMVPHRDMYEKKKELPSNWNFDHKSYWVPLNNENEWTFGLLQTMQTAIPDAEIISLKTLDENFISESSITHSSGEYSIELIARKKWHSTHLCV